MECLEFQITAEQVGERLDSYLADNIDEASRAYLQKLIAQELVLVNKRAVKANYRLKLNDELTVQLPDVEPLEIEPEDIALAIVYEDEDVLVVNKPQGMVVHPAHGHYSGTLVNALLYHCQDLSGINGKLRPGIVHRIDKDTSGLIMVAKNDLAHQSLAAQLQAHSVERAYIALAQGVIAEAAGIVDAPIGRHESDRKKMAVTLNHSKEARTKYQVKKRFSQHTLIECRLETGRTHQIRVHMAYIGHPLVGDPLYGQRKNNLHFQGQALHAYLLGFLHPRTGERLSFQVPLPELFASELRRLEREV